MLSKSKLREAEIKLRDAIAKRWPMRCYTKRGGVYVAELPNGKLSHFSLHEYHHPLMHKVSVLRLTDIFSAPMGRDYLYHRANGIGSLELSFLPEETDRAIAWGLDNYLGSKGKYPRWLSQRWKANLEPPARFKYFWSDRAAKALGRD